MELEGFIRCKNQLESRGGEVATITTDRNRTVAKYIRENWEDTVHQYDVWHIAKSMTFNSFSFMHYEMYALLHYFEDANILKSL